jgi:uncharacterized membrane protein (UPF0127 family)
MHGHRRALVFTLLTVAAVAVVVGAVLLFGAADDSTPEAAGSPLSAAIGRQTPATVPFKGLGELRVAVGRERCLRLAVADSLDERVAGLRGHNDLGPYDGMVFVFQGPTDAGFTMAGVTIPLEIGFYGPNGARVSHRLMRPCPHKAESQCPGYRADGQYMFAVETHEGGLPSGPLTACATA